MVELKLFRDWWPSGWKSARSDVNITSICSGCVRYEISSFCSSLHHDGLRLAGLRIQATPGRYKRVADWVAAWHEFSWRWRVFLHGFFQEMASTVEWPWNRWKPAGSNPQWPWNRCRPRGRGLGHGACLLLPPRIRQGKNVRGHQYSAMKSLDRLNICRRESERKHRAKSDQPADARIIGRVTATLPPNNA